MAKPNFMKYATVKNSTRFIVVVDVKPDVGDIAGFDTFVYRGRSVNVTAFPNAKRAVVFFNKLGAVMKGLAREAGLFTQFQWCASIVDRKYGVVVDTATLMQISNGGFQDNISYLLDTPGSEKATASELINLLKSSQHKQKLSRTLLSGLTIQGFMKFCGIRFHTEDWPIETDVTFPGKLDLWELTSGQKQWFDVYTPPRGYPKALSDNWVKVPFNLEEALSYYRKPAIDYYMRYKVLVEDKSYNSIKIRLAAVKITQLLTLENPLTRSYFIERMLDQKVDFVNMDTLRKWVAENAYLYLAQNGFDFPANESASVLFDNARSLYVQRTVTNPEDILAWAKDVGVGEFADLASPEDLHITQVYSKEPVIWEHFKFDEDDLELDEDHSRGLEIFDGGAVVLRVNSDHMQTRWKFFKEKGCSWDFPDYKPHITIGYMKDGMEPPVVNQLVPYFGRVGLGPERPDTVNGW